MNIWMIIAIYIFVGHLASVLYEDRDINLSNEIESLAYKRFDTDTASARFHLDEILKRAGWCFWRRKKPFSMLPRVINEIIGIAIWPIDLTLCEIGYRKEFDYLKEFDQTYLAHKTRF